MLTEAPVETISEQIWSLKYRHQKPCGAREQVIDDTWCRVATALASVEAPKEIPFWQSRFFQAMSAFQLIPAGRIVATAGIDSAQTMINTFVMDEFDDTVEGITRIACDAAVTMRMGGGIGYDFSKITPKGMVQGEHGASAGPLAAMEVCDAVSGLMASSRRRGAMMATMRCDHPDIREFVTAKSDQRRFRNFNLSVMITDEFMKTVKSDGMWPLRWHGRIVDAVPVHELWDLVMRNTYEAAEPGVLFIDRINADNRLNYLEAISATNSCAEQPLPPHGSAPLASINLARLVRSPFEQEAVLDLHRLRELAAVAVRMLDNVIEISKYPTEAQSNEARAKRRIGIGVTGAANALAMIGETYGSTSAAEHLECWMRELQHATTAASVELARIRGTFDGFCAERYCATPRNLALDPCLQASIRKHGVRNALTTSIAPTGTISLLAGNVSSGIEPVFALSYDRKVKMPGGEERMQKMEDYAVSLYRQKFGANAALPEQFITAMTLDPHHHITMQAAAQRWTESSISKTINCPKNIGFEQFKDIYWHAYKAGCKGCTTYRPNDITGAVLSVDTVEQCQSLKKAKRLNRDRAISA